MSYRRINITIPEDTLSELDTLAAEDVSTRSNYIRDAIALKKQMDTLIIHRNVDPEKLEKLVFACRMQRADRKYIREMRKLSFQQMQD